MANVLALEPVAYHAAGLPAFLRDRFDCCSGIAIRPGRSCKNEGARFQSLFPGKAKGPDSQVKTISHLADFIHHVHHSSREGESRDSKISMTCPTGRARKPETVHSWDRHIFTIICPSHRHRSRHLLKGTHMVFSRPKETQISPPDNLAVVFHLAEFLASPRRPW